MSGHAHQSPAEIRAKLNHPIIDGDGHWVEYDPVFAEQMRKVGGDKAADGFLAAMAVTRDSLLLSVEERRRRRVSMPGFWTRQTGNTYDRATAMMPHLLYERLDEIGAAPSIGTVGDSYDNALAESVMGLYKTELHRNPAVLAAHGGHWEGLDDLEAAICAWVAWFNSERIHSELGDCTPDEFEASWHASQAA